MSRLIRNEELQRDAQPMVALNLCDIEGKAREAVDRARGEARRILTEAVAHAREAERVAAARGEKAGFDAGMARGIEEGRRQGLEQETARVREATATVREALMEMIGEIESRRHDVISDAKDGLLRLSLAIAERLCRARLAQCPDHLRPLVEEVIEAAGRRKGLLLRVNPADAKAVEAFLADLHAATHGDETAAIRVAADEGIERGGCVAEHAAEKVDGRIETQIQRIVSELLGAGASTAGDAEETA